MNAKVIAALIAFAVAATPLKSLAGCHTGEVPRWSDVDSIEVTRCQLINKRYPCYDALLANGPADSVDAYVTAVRLKTGGGRFIVNAATGKENWPALVAHLRQAGFFNLELRQRPAPPKFLVTINTDGPRDQIAVRQCWKWVTITRDEFLFEHDAANRTFQSLLDVFETEIESLPLTADARGTRPVTGSDVERHFFQ